MASCGRGHSGDTTNSPTAAAAAAPATARRRRARAGMVRMVARCGAGGGWGPSAAGCVSPQSYLGLYLGWRPQHVLTPHPANHIEVPLPLLLFGSK